MPGSPPSICILALFLLVDYAGGQVYPSLQWFALNPVFMKNTTKCVPEMKVLPNSKIHVVCPTTVTVLRTVQSAKPKHELYENLWMVHDKESFDSCAPNASSPTSPKTANKLLMECDDPLVLKYFTIVFQKFSPSSGDPEFKPGKEYYFLATSDGSQGSLRADSGGHCNDTQSGVQMKFKVYVCNEENDPLCADETYDTFGTLKCPFEPTTKPTPPATTTAAVTTATNVTEPGSPTSATEPAETALPVTPEARTGNTKGTDIYMILFFASLALFCLSVIVIVYHRYRYSCTKVRPSCTEKQESGELTKNECSLTNHAYRYSTHFPDVTDGTAKDQQVKNTNEVKSLNNGRTKEESSTTEKLPNNNLRDEELNKNEMLV